MKNKNKYALVLLSTCILLVFNSCSEDDSLMNNLESNVNMNKIENVLTLEGQGQKIAYRMLSENEKLFLWQDKLANLLESIDFNSSQIKYINELRKTLKLEYFYFENQKGKYYTDYLVEMKKIGYTLFNAKEMAIYFSSLDSTYEKVVQNPPNIHCHCSTSDDWCVTGDCYSFYCTSADDGCGWWLREDCNGFCATND